MLKRFIKSVREYKLPTILTLIFIVGEVVIEAVIPFITADLVNCIKDGAGTDRIVKTGLFLIGLAVLSLAFGGIAGFTCAKASSGFAAS